MTRISHFGFFCLAVLFLPARLSAQCQELLKAAGGYAGFNQYLYSVYSDDPDGTGPAPPTLYAGGAFDIAGDGFAGRIAAWNGTRWVPVGNGVSSLLFIESMVRFNGKLVVAGYGGTQAWNGSAWSSMSLGQPSSGLNKLVVFQNTLWGGSDGALRWTNTGWQVPGGGVGGSVHAMCVFDGKLYVGGTVNFANGSPTQKMASWNGVSWSPMTTGMDGTVEDLMVYNGRLIAGGSFVHAGGVTVNHIAQFDGTTWSELGDGLGGTADCLSQYMGDLIAGGAFTSLGDVRTSKMARWNGSSWSPLDHDDPILGVNVSTMTVHDGALVLGGTLGAAGETQCAHIARWNGAFSSLGTGGFDATVNGFGHLNGSLVAVGEFTFVQNQRANGVALWDDLAQTWKSLDNAPTGRGTCATEFNGNLVVGGGLMIAESFGVKSVVARNGSEWSLLGTFSGDPNCYVASLVQIGHQLVAGGRFTIVDGVNASNIAMWNGGQWHSLGTGLSSLVSALGVYNGELIAAGDFPNHIARWDGNSWVALGGGLNSRVQSIVVQGDTLYAGGGFTDPQGNADFVAKWDGYSWKYIGGPHLAYVRALALRTGELFATFSKNNLNSGLAKLSGSSWVAVVSKSNRTIQCLDSQQSDLFIGGGFDNLDNHVSAFWARYGPLCPAANLSRD